MRYALCIGLNDYPGTGSDLAGCVNDANDWAEELTKREFDVEVRRDAHFDNRPNGALTYVALNALRDLPAGATYKDWMVAVSQRLPSQDYPQTPGLDGSSTQRKWPVLA
jgi:hypothetical protein